MKIFLPYCQNISISVLSNRYLKYFFCVLVAVYIYTRPLEAWPMSTRNCLVPFFVKTFLPLLTVKIFLFLYYLSTYFVFWWLYIYPATWGPLVTTSPLRLQPVTGRRARWKKSRRESCKKYFLRNAKILPEKCKNTSSEVQQYYGSA